MAIKTQANDGNIEEFLAEVRNQRRVADARTVMAIFEEITGTAPQMWGPSIIGYGSQPYTNTTGTHEWFVMGLSPRAAALTIYGLWDDYNPDPRFESLGPHTVGKGCLYIKRVEQIDLDLLRTFAREVWEKAGASN